MPSWSDLRRFLVKDGWTRYRRGARQDLYRKILPDWTVLETRVSRQSGEIRDLWPHILHRQLRCSQRASPDLAPRQDRPDHLDNAAAMAH